MKRTRKSGPDSTDYPILHLPPLGGSAGASEVQLDGEGDVEQEKLSEWDLLVDEAIQEAERRLADERTRAQRRAVQLAREQAYHRLAVELDRPRNNHEVGEAQLSFFPKDPTLFDED